MHTSKKIAIIGTAGIPSKYGGFETLTEYLTKHIGTKIKITVYCSSKKYKDKLLKHNGATLRYLPLDANGMQSTAYDILSLFHAARSHDLILILGVSGCIILPLFRLFYPKTKLIINIDGLEHRREKWNKPIKKFLKYSERLAVKFGDVIISDNKAIQDYVLDEYKKTSRMIAYGGDHAQKVPSSPEVIQQYGIPKEYAFKVCRIEPENNIHLILEAFSHSPLPLVIIGNWNKSDYGIKLKEKYKSSASTILLDPIYNQNKLDQIRSNCKIYVHGHSAGGTNPSLVEAMSLGLPVFSFDVYYNRETTQNKAKYFKNKEELVRLIQNISEPEIQKLGNEMKAIADKEYTWQKIANQYLELFKQYYTPPCQ